MQKFGADKYYSSESISESKHTSACGLSQAAKGGSAAPERIGDRVPSGERVLTDSPIARLAYQVGVAGVPPMLLDQIADQPAQAGTAAIGAGDVHGLVKTATRPSRFTRPYGPLIPDAERP